MRRLVLQMAFACGCVTAFTGADWLGFRGPDGGGVSTDVGLPMKWSETEGVAWKAELPGRGLSTPIVVGDKVFVTCSSGVRQDRLHLLCFHADTGAKLWERQTWATGRTMAHPKTAVAAPTPTSDGQRIFTFYSSNDVVAYSLDGDLLWHRGLTYDYPNASNSLGMASSPIVVSGVLVLQVENDSDSFALGLDPATGVNRWKIERPAKANWTSPAVVRGAKPADALVLLQSSSSLSAHDPATGRAVWTFAEGCSTIPSCTVSGDLIVAPSAGLTALRHVPGSQAPEKLWDDNRLAPSTASPIVYMNFVFSLNKAGVLRAADLKTGETQWQLRLKGPFSGTPVAADGHLFFFNETGEGQVVKIGPEAGEIVGGGKLTDEAVLCTPAVAGSAIYVRSDAHVWKLAK